MDPSSSTEDILFHLIERRERGESVDLDRLKEQRPHEAALLQRMFAEWSKQLAPADRRRPAGEEEKTVCDSLRDLVGAAVDPGIRLDADLPPAASPEDDSELLRAMKVRGPAAGRYEMKEEIGRGGMGAVLRVYDRELRRNLAMKVLLGGDGSLLRVDSPGSRTEPQRLSRFLEEAQVTAQLDHPGIVPVHELGIDAQGSVFFLMKLVKGETLSQVFDKVLSKVDGWTKTRALGVILRVCEAMDFAHRRKVVHRDLKPSNVMVGELGETYVMDWGLARVLDRPDTKDIRVRADSTVFSRRVSTDRASRSGATPDSPLLTNDGDRLGTPAYMSPEQADGSLDLIGPRSDVYSVGAILYHLLAGQAPYIGREPLPAVAIIDRVCAGPPAPLHDIAKHVSPELQSICEKAMARDVAERYASMTELAADLRAYLENRVVKAHRGGALVELRKWVQRNRMAAWATAAAVLIALTGLAAFGAIWVVRESDLGRLAETREKRDDAERELTSARERADETAKDLTNKRASLASATADVEARRTEAAEAVRRAAEAKRIADDLATRSGKLERELQTLQIEKEQSTTALAAANRAVDDANAAVRQQTAESERMKGEIQDLGEGLESVNRALDTATRDRDAAVASVRPLLDLKRIRDLESEAARLWPARPELAAAMRAWLERARVLVDRAAQHRERLSAIAIAPPASDAVGDPDWSRDTLAELVDRAGRLERDVVPDVERRLDAAERIVGFTLETNGPAWTQAIAEIGDASLCPIYGGLSLAPIVGLVPLGRDLVTGLHEFWHVESGERPERGSPRDDDGIVLVLVPGGTFRMGSRELDFLAFPEARGRQVEQPVHEVAVEPFLIAKFELTQRQWRRCGASAVLARYREGDRVGGRVITGRNPIESVTWDECRVALARVALALPTEAQWEWAARGGTETPWWCGLDGRDAWQAGNVADVYAAQHGGGDWSSERRLDDGNFVHAPVGWFRPNPFGLHDVIGNVAEWCLDDFGPYADCVAIDVHGLHTYAKSTERAVRGGSYRESIALCRSSARAALAPASSAANVGVRPVLNVR